jgi:hypothetical protein
MAEHRLFPEGTVPRVSTYDFHQHRGRARHLEEGTHHNRLMIAAAFVYDAYVLNDRSLTVSDLGCGDGGLLSLLTFDGLQAWGYDFTPANVTGARERDVAVNQLDVFGDGRDQVLLGQLTIMTEVLEHLADPHGVLRWVATESEWLVASSPWDETDESHDECHAWAWDQDGYRRMLHDNGWEVIQGTTLPFKFQVVLARRRPDQ